MSNAASHGSCGIGLAPTLALPLAAALFLAPVCRRVCVFLASNGSCKVRIDLVRFTAIKDTNAKKFLFCAALSIKK